MLHFAYPFLLFSLLLVPLLALVLLQQATRARHDVETYARAGVLAKMGLARRGKLRLVRAGLLLAAVACGLFALAEPRWGGNNAQNTSTASGGSLVIVLDVSHSMLAQDMGGESRLATAQRIVAKLLTGLPGWRVGVVGFAGEGQALVPLTTDTSAIDTMLARAQPGEVPGKGTNLNAGLAATLPLYDQPGRRVALVLTDGEELTGDATKEIAAFRDAHIEIDAVGLGTPDGAYIPGPADVWGNPSYMTFRGEKVLSRLNEAPLHALANATNGFYVRALDGAAADLTGRFNAAAANAPVPESGGTGREFFQLPLALMLLLVGLETILGLPPLRRREKRHFGDDLQLALRGPATAVLLAAILLTQSGWAWYPAWLPNREAGAAYKAGEYGRAAKLLDEALKHDHTHYGLLYNRANVAYQLKHYDEAIGLYRQALAHADTATKPVVAYNLGNAYFRQAEANNSPAGYKQAIEVYNKVLAASPQDADARFNMQVANARLHPKPPPKKSDAPKKQTGGDQGKGKQGAGQAQGGGRVGLNQTYHPPALPRNLPSEGEVDQLLQALESDERQRQAEQGAEHSPENAGGPFAQQMLNQALDSLDLQKDW